MVDETKLSVQEAIAEVMRRLPAIGKDEKAPANMGGFAYRGIEAMTKVIQPIMADIGLVIVPRARLVSVVIPPGQRNDAMQDVTLEVSWTIVGPDGSTLEAQTVGIGRDHTDKGATKAQTQAFKYLLMELFCVSDAEDDGDGHDYTQADRNDEPEQPVRFVSVFERAKAWAARDKSAAETLRSLAELAGFKLTIANLRDNLAFLDAIEDTLDGFDATAAQEAHTGPQIPVDEERQVQ